LAQAVFGLPTELASAPARAPSHPVGAPLRLEWRRMCLPGSQVSPGFMCPTGSPSSDYQCMTEWQQFMRTSIGGLPGAAAWPTSSPLWSSSSSSEATPLPMQVPGMFVTGLTKGARRRLQQRLKKKLGRQARQEQLAMMEMMQPAIPVMDVCTNFGLPRAQSASIPSTMMYSGIMQVAGSMIVPVCAVQAVPRLDEAPQGEVADALVPLPRLLGKGALGPIAMEEEKASGTPEPAVAQAEAGAVGGSGCEDSKSDEGKLPEKLPTVNTFVHFKAAQAPRRRSLSA